MSWRSNWSPEHRPSERSERPSVRAVRVSGGQRLSQGRRNEEGPLFWCFASISQKASSVGLTYTNREIPRQRNKGKRSEGTEVDLHLLLNNNVQFGITKRLRDLNVKQSRFTIWCSITYAVWIKYPFYNIIIFDFFSSFLFNNYRVHNKRNLMG